MFDADNDIEIKASEVDAVVPPGVTHIGFVPFSMDRHVLFAHPYGQPYGVSTTFPKIRIKPGELPSSALRSCLEEKVGMPAKSLFPLPSTWSTENSSTFYFAGLVQELGQESTPIPALPCLNWYTPEQAEAKLQASHNRISQRRDLSVLKAASAMCLSPCRRVLLMVSELHKLGFERLRVFACLPSAWRCAVLPTAWVSKRHGDEEISTYGIRDLTKTSYQGYSSSIGQRVFSDWTDVSPFESPSKLAREFIARLPVIAALAWGPEPEYVDWFNVTLKATEPNGIFYFFGKDEPYTEWLYTKGCREHRLALPPPGEADSSAFKRITEKLKPLCQ